MEYTMLSNGALKVSRLSIGTWAFSGAAVWGDNAVADSIRSIHMAMDHGINLIDTAEQYGDGQSELILGKALQGRRQDAVLATKVWSGKLHTEDLIRCCEGSLRRLGTDYIDIYQIHWPNRDIPLEESFEAIETLKRDGKVRCASVCNFGPQDIQIAARYGAVLNQLPYSLIWRAIEHEIIPASEAAGIPVWPYMALGQGLLSGKFRTIDDVPLHRRANRFYSCKWGQVRHTENGFEDGIFSYLDQLRTLCEETGFDMPTLALAFLKAQSAVSSILVGARNEQQLAQNLAAYHAEVPADVLAKAIALSEPLKALQGRNADLWENANGGRMR